MIRFTLDGREVAADDGETIFAVAAREGIALPHKCHKDGLTPAGNCRACVVEIAGERALAPSCCRVPREGMQVATASERAVQAREGILALLATETASKQAVDDSHPAIRFDPGLCISCTRCIRACRDIQGNNVIGLDARGGIVFDAGVPLGRSSCVACGECVAACPTDALTSKRDATAEKSVDSLCPFCGVGCQITYRTRDNTIVGADGRDGPANAGRLCVKGRYGYDYPRHPGRLTVPLIRRADAPKDPSLAGTAEDWRTQFREASWEEALDFAAAGLLAAKRDHGPHALAGFGSAKGSNEEAYLFQKLVRTGFGTHNVDHCTRLCHASSVAALLEGLGSGAVSNPVRDVEFADVIIVIGANPAVNHPVAASFIRNAARREENPAQLILMDPRVTELARDATHVLPFRADTDVLLINALLHVIVFEGLVNEAFVAARVEGYGDAFRDNLKPFAPEIVAGEVGIPAVTLRTVARTYAGAKAALIFWGMGVSQHTHGTDNVRGLIAMALLTGQIGRRGAGLHPLRGQNNVQGASDAGLIPMMLPDYRRVADTAVRAHFESLWGTPLPGRPGLTVTEILKAASVEGGREIRAMYVMGENPAMSDPDLNHARAALAALDHLVVQDIFLTETAALADVILPASAFAEKTGSFTNTDRMVQLGRAAISPPGQARQDLDLIMDIARRLGLDWNYDGPGEVFEEMRRAMPGIAGISWQRLQREGSVTYPCADDADPGQPVIFTGRFPTASGRGRLVPVAFRPADETPDADFPFVLITGRQLEHWHTGSMTRRAAVLDALEPAAYVNLHPDDLAALKVGQPSPSFPLPEREREADSPSLPSRERGWERGIGATAAVRLQTRRGELVASARADAGLARGTVFMPFCYVEAAANLLTNPALDPDGKIPEFKYCAVKVTAAGP